ncbi:prolipoprotein diacylglyceryl transferase family protein [Senegalia massiliensis]|uniref:prolipoprotein diacylglyceryl transferase family protein n=1 Tax=Senegalia massiliensis TaxID=1720316 RepID=UPI001032558E|nr:prolipoprotein diacylglyceryl transferase family protein [Senegalia massiliensis]
MKPIFLSIGPVNITWFLLFAVVLTIIGYIILKVISKNNKYRKVMEDYYLLELILGFVGARIVYVIFHLDVYAGRLIDAIRPNHYNLNLLGGVLIAVIVLFVLTKRKGEPFLVILNYLLVPFYFSIAIGIWAFEFEGILSNSNSIETLIYSIMFFVILVSHLLLFEKYKKVGLITLSLSMIFYYGLEILL